MINLSKIKFFAMNALYTGIDQGYDHFTSLEMARGDTEWKLESNLEKLIWLFTLTTRFYRMGKSLYESFETDVRTALSNFKSLNLSELEMSEEDKKQFQADAKEVEEYLVWLDKNKLK